MARHSTGKNSFAIAPWLAVVLAVAAVAAIGGAVWLATRGGNDDVSAAPAETSAGAQRAPQDSQTPETPKKTSATATTQAATETSTQSQSALPSESLKPTATSQAATSAAAASVSVADTLFLVDTSGAMTGRAGAVAQAVGTAARAVSAEGKSVALWNYSSPLSPGVTVGYRDNLGFGSGDAVAESVALLGTGGVPQTRSAVVAALATATDEAATTGSARVVLVTSGTEQDMDDAAFDAALQQAKGKGVALSVVHVGDGTADQALKAAAEHYQATDDTNAAIAAAAGV